MCSHAPELRYYGSSGVVSVTVLYSGEWVSGSGGLHVHSLGQKPQIRSFLLHLRYCCWRRRRKMEVEKFPPPTPLLLLEEEEEDV